MIDLHCHVLHRIDDGASSLEESLLMLREAEAQGVSCVVATPHLNWQICEMNTNKIKRIQSRHTELLDAVKVNGIKVDLLLGYEIEINDEACLWKNRSWYSKQKLGLGDSSTWLLECADDLKFLNTLGLFLRMRLKGIQVLMAHPEFSGFSFLELVLFKWIAGIRLQVTASCFSVSKEKELRLWFRKAKWLGLIDLIASDGHSSSEGDRPIGLLEDRKALERRYGTGALEKWSRTMPMLLTKRKRIMPNLGLMGLCFLIGFGSFAWLSGLANVRTLESDRPVIMAEKSDPNEHALSKERLIREPGLGEVVEVSVEPDGVAKVEVIKGANGIDKNDVVLEDEAIAGSGSLNGELSKDVSALVKDFNTQVNDAKISDLKAVQVDEYKAKTIKELAELQGIYESFIESLYIAAKRDLSKTKTAEDKADLYLKYYDVISTAEKSCDAKVNKILYSYQLYLEENKLPLKSVQELRSAYIHMKEEKRNGFGVK